MNLKFDYYNNLESPDLYLYNPDGRDLFPIIGTERLLTLRFNDLSELSFACYSTTTSNVGDIISLEYYDWLQTRRLVYLDRVGWFMIKKVDEHDDGVVKYKSINCESLQTVFKDRGFFTEERVYHFYNPSDPTDANYDPDDEASIPSVVGQLYRQLGVQLDLTQGLDDPLAAYGDWTITYINEDIMAANRNFKENTTYGYDFMVKDASEAFEAIFLFDFMYRTIHIMVTSEITQRANVLYSFSNFMKEVNVEENSENIVTVLNCNGDNCDITGVNPTGTNYICDFTYYMDEVNHRWMSDGLIQAIKSWKAVVDANRSEYRRNVLALRTAYDLKASLQSELQDISMVYTDLSAAVANKSVAIAEDSTVRPHGIVWAETVETSKTSLDEHSAYHSSAFTSSSTITCYIDPPQFNEAAGTWYFSGGGITGTAEYCYGYVDGNNKQYHYFIDSDNNTSYCMLEGTATNVSSTSANYTVKGFKRYIDLEIANVWMKKYETVKVQKEAAIAQVDSDIADYSSTLETISDACNILKYFATYVSPIYLKELYCYWIDGDYTNDNIAVLEDTSQAEALDLVQELMDAGEVELAKICQPKLQFSLSSVDCTKLYEFRDQMSELELGKIVTVEKEEGLWYYPALLEIEINLDTTDTFNLKFANAFRLDDWGYTYGDLISDASATSRQVSANWQNFLQYSKDKSTISDLIKDPLSMTLRAAFANMTNQEFTIDDTGILGRKFVDSNKNSFFDEQMRIINNVILFTDDNWDTVKTALGKIYYTDTDPTSPTYGQTVSKYGLIAEAIIGELIMGEKLIIRNEDSSVVINEDGINITNGSGQSVFRADDNGVVTVNGYATEAALLAGLGTKNKVYRQASAPTGNDLVTGDIWIDTDDDNKMYVWDGANWNITLANAATTYRQDFAPTALQATLREGDLWIDTDDNNKLYRYSANFGWQLVADLRIDTLNTNVSNLSTSIGSDIVDVQIIYYLSLSPPTDPWTGGQWRPSAPMGWVTTATTFSETWSTIIPSPVKGYHYYSCVQYKLNNGTVVNNGVVYNDTDSTILQWCATADTTKIDGGTIYTGTIYAASLNTQSIVTNLLTVKTTNPYNPLDQSVIFQADPANNTVQIGNFTVGKTFSQYNTNVSYLCSNNHNSLWDTSYSGVYVGDDGISVLAPTQYDTFGNPLPMKRMLLDVVNGLFSFNGTVYAESGEFKGGIYASYGNFANGCTIGSSTYPFYIGTSTETYNSPCIYSRSSYFPGMGGLGIAQDNYVYIGGDGFSYWDGGNYGTVIRPGTFLCCTTASSTGGSGIGMVGGNLYFSYNTSGSLLSNSVIGSQVCYFATLPTLVHVYGDFYYNQGLTLNSDQNVKNSISQPSDEYDVLFDSLQPVIFKYNHGKSGRLHSGFVAQDVLAAIEKSGLTTQDFAAYVEAQTEAKDVARGLRYDEFISLNTWQIQKLKQRVAALEAVIAQMQNTK